MGYAALGKCAYTIESVSITHEKHGLSNFWRCNAKNFLVSGISDCALLNCRCHVVCRVALHLATEKRLHHVPPIANKNLQKSDLFLRLIASR